MLKNLIVALLAASILTSCAYYTTDDGVGYRVIQPFPILTHYPHLDDEDE